MKFENAEVSVIKSKRKTLSIQVKPNEVIICAPLKMKEKEIEELTESKRNWIEKHLQSVYERQKLLQDTEQYTEEEIRGFIAKAKEIIPPKVEFFADKIGVTCEMVDFIKSQPQIKAVLAGHLHFSFVSDIAPGKPQFITGGGYEDQVRELTIT